MKEFNKLLEIADTLLGPNGCAWDKKQTYATLRPYLIEEAHEAVDEIDAADIPGMVEELGDLFYTIIFYAKLGEKENDFTLKQVFEKIAEKLIRRHPHVFGEESTEDLDEIIQRWDKIKSAEKKERKSILDGIPKSLGSIARAQKVIEKMFRKEMNFPSKEDKKRSKEEGIGDKLIDLIIEARQEGIDAECALRTSLRKWEKNICDWEEEQKA